jgi:hypothetical protein
VFNIIAKKDYLKSLELASIICQYHYNKIKPFMNFTFYGSEENIDTIVLIAANFYALLYNMASMLDILGQLINDKIIIDKLEEKCVELNKIRTSSSSKPELKFLEKPLNTLYEESQYQRDLVNTIKHRNLVFINQGYSLAMLGVIHGYVVISNFTYERRTYPAKPLSVVVDELIKIVDKIKEVVILIPGLTFDENPKKLFFKNAAI